MEMEMDEKFELHPDLQRDGIRMGSFPLCLVLLINDRNYPWFVLVPAIGGLRELYELDEISYRVYGAESLVLGKTIMRLFAGDKLNVAALGNLTPQLHIHHVVRHETDAAWPGPIWGQRPLSPYRPSEIDEIRCRLVAAGMEGFESHAAH